MYNGYICTLYNIDNIIKSTIKLVLLLNQQLVIILNKCVSLYLI